MLSISSLFGSLYGYGIVAILLTVAIVISTYLLQTKIQSLKCFVERQMSPLGAVRRNEVPQEPPRVRGNGVEDLVDLGRREELTAPGPVPPRDRLQLWSKPEFADFLLSRDDVTLVKEIGRGSYGVVYEAKVKGCRCAAKQLHGYLLQSYRIINNFIRECEILSSLQHPNIVKFVGVCEDLRVVVMELMSTSLTSYIDKDARKKLTLGELQVSEKHMILYDVALGLQYLHNGVKPIIHRDLTANNVLLTEKRPPQAKIADLGQAMITSPDQAQRMTQAPGTMCYMPPEVMVNNPMYDKSVDIFSFGVLILHCMSEEWPLPSDVIEQDMITGAVIKAKTELEKRHQYVDKIQTKTPLTPLVEQCLRDSSSNRPTIVSVIASVSSAVAQDMNKDNLTSTNRSLVVGYTNNLVDRKSPTLKISLQSSSEFCVVVRPPVRLGFTGTYLKTVPFSSKLLYYPMDIAIDKDGGIYVCDYSGKIGVYKYDTISETSSNVLLAATSKWRITRDTCYYPQGIAIDSEKNVYLADTYSQRVLKISPQGVVTAVVGEILKSGYDRFHFNEPSGIAVNEQQVYVCDTNNHRVRILDNKLNILPEVDPLCCTRAFSPTDIAFGMEGKYAYVLDKVNKNIHLFNLGQRQKCIAEINLNDEERYSLKEPRGIYVDTNNFIYVTDSGKHGVLVLNPFGKFVMFFGCRGSRNGELNTPRGITVDSQGHVYICDYGNRRVQVFV